MKRIIILSIGICFCASLDAQVKWDGGGDGVSWNDPANWLPDGVPLATSNVKLDNSTILSSYTVNLGSTNITTFVNTLSISPGSGISIVLKIPATNTANPGLNVGGMGDALIIDSGATILNSTGVAGGGVGLVVSNGIRINNGGKYIHNNIRGNAGIVSQLSSASGTEKGIFEFDVPGTAGYAVSLSGRTFGTLIFSANAAGLSRTYTGNGTSNLAIRGDLIINPGATMSCTITGNVVLSGNLAISGVLNDNPSSAGAVNRSISFVGANQIISGTGNLILGANFRNLEINGGSTLTLNRNIALSNPNQGFIVDSAGSLLMNSAFISGLGKFQLNKGSLLGIGSIDGIWLAPTALGNIQTATRLFAADAGYEYNGIDPQVTGDGLPTTLNGQLKVNNTAGISSLGVTLTNSTMISGMTGRLDLSLGKLRTSPGNIIHIGPDATIVNYGANSFIGGPLRATGHPTFTYPVGLNAPVAPTGSIYAPVTMNDASGNNVLNESYTVEYHRANPSATIGPALGDSINHLSYLEYWSILRNDTLNNQPPKQLTLEVNPESFCYKLDSTLIARYDTSSTQWKSEGRSAFYINPLSAFPLEWGRISSEPHISAFGYFTLATTLPFAGNPLPIRILSFDATRINISAALVKWELGNNCSPATTFEIQKAGINGQFSTIAVMHAMANEKVYQHIDNALSRGINYYRLKIIDEDRNNYLSRTAGVFNDIEDLLLVSLTPSPVNTNATLTLLSSRRQQVDLVITDMLGRIVKKKNLIAPAGESRVELSMFELTGGLYDIIGITSNGKTNAIKFIK